MRACLDVHIGTALNINYTTVLPHFTCCATILYLFCKKDVKRLQKLQNRGMKLLLCCSRYTRTQKMLDNLGWITISEFIERHVLIFIYKVKNGLLSQSLKTKLINIKTRRVWSRGSVPASGSQRSGFDCHPGLRCL